MKKKLVTMLLMAAMTASLIACGSEGEGDSQDGTGQDNAGQNSTAQDSEAGSDAGAGSSDEESQEESQAAEGASADVNYYGYEEPVTIKIGISYSAAADFTFLGGETVEDNTWMSLYKANNIMPEIMYEVDPSQADTKLSTAILSGDYPDVFEGTGAEYKNYVESGAVADITEAYEQYASPELKEYMNNYDGGMALGSLYIDGRLYGLPKVSDPYSNAHVMWIRQDWLDNLGLQIPETMDELKEVAHAFTYDDPDGNGRNDTYGLALDGINVLNNSVGNAEPIFNGFGCYFSASGLSYIDDGNGEIIWGGANTEGMKQALQFLKELYDDKSLATDFITMDDQSVFAEAGAGRCGIWFGPNWGAMDPAQNASLNNPDCHIVAAAVPSATGEATKAYASATVNKVYFVSSKCTNPEVLVKLWNLSVKYQNAEYCTAEEYNMYFGDSVNYTGQKTSLISGEAPNGRSTNLALTEALKTGDESVLTAKQLENYTAIKTYMDAVADGTFDPNDTVQKRGLSLYTVHADERSAWSVLHKMIADHDYVDAAFNGIPSDAVSEASTTLKKQLTETIVKVVTGAQEVDSYDSFLNTWYAYGGQDAMDEANDAL